MLLGLCKDYYQSLQRRQPNFSIRWLQGSTITLWIWRRTCDSEGGNERIVRLITVKLKKATRDGDKELKILTNLLDEVEAKAVAQLYRKRWLIETLFQQLTVEPKSEINTLGYPQGEFLFSFSVSNAVIRKHFRDSA